MRATVRQLRSLRPSAPALLALLLLWSQAPAARAGDLYVGGGLAISGGFADGAGVLDFGPTFPIAGSDTDSSPVVAGVVGFEFPIHQILPRRYRSPRWLPDIDLEDWALRFETEVAGGRSYEFLLPASGTSTFLARVSTITTTLNAWLELPIGHLLERFLGRSRTLHDVSFNLGGGIGYQYAKVKASNFSAQGEQRHHDFVGQVGVEAGIPLTDSVILTTGYRWVATPDPLEVELGDGTPTDRGVLLADVSSHEFRTQLRYRFYSLRFPRGLFDKRRASYQP